MAMGTAVLATEPAPVEEVKKPSVAEVPLPDVKSGEDVSPQERAKMEAEVAESSKKTEAHWRSKADAKDWDSVATITSRFTLCTVARIARVQSWHPSLSSTLEPPTSSLSCPWLCMLSIVS